MHLFIDKFIEFSEITAKMQEFRGIYMYYWSISSKKLYYCRNCALRSVCPTKKLHFCRNSSSLVAEISFFKHLIVRFNP